MSKKKARWDRYAIKAAVHRSGLTLTELATSNGLEPSACRVALLRQHAAGEKAIATRLGMPLWVLWPSRYPVNNDSQDRSSATRTAPASPIARSV